MLKGRIGESCGLRKLTQARRTYWVFTVDGPTEHGQRYRLVSEFHYERR